MFQVLHKFRVAELQTVVVFTQTIGEDYKKWSNISDQIIGEDCYKKQNNIFYQIVGEDYHKNLSNISEHCLVALFSPFLVGDQM